MSQQNVEIVRAAFDAYLRGDMESALRNVDPEIVVIQRSELPDAATRHGHAGVAEAIAVWPDQWGTTIGSRSLRSATPANT